MEGFKFPLLIWLLIFHCSNSSDISRVPETVEIKPRQVNEMVDKINEVQEATLLKVLVKYKDETNNLMSAYTESLKNIVKESREEQKETHKLLKNYMDRTETKMNETNGLLERTTQILTGIKEQKEDNTFDDLTAVQNQVTDGDGDEVIQGTVHLFTEEVRYPQEALGFFSLESKYNKKIAPSDKSVRGWMKPTFVADIDSMKRRMGLEIYFVLKWQEDSSRVNWALKDAMRKGSAFSFSPAILE